MPVLQITCPHCRSATKIESERLPAGPLGLPCPTCQGQVILDRDRLLAGEPAQAGEPPPGGAVLATQAVQMAPRAAAPAPPVPVATPQTAPPAASTSLPPNFSIPEGTRLPSGLVVAADPAALTPLFAALEPYGAAFQALASLEQVFELDYAPEILVVAGGAVAASAGATLAPLLELDPRKRRRMFVMLVADDVRSMDGNQAFLQNADLVVGKADLARAPLFLYAALEFRERLCGAHLHAEEASATI